MSQPRVMVAALSLSAATLVGIALHEGYTDQAIRPLPGDVPTFGFGSTTKPDGAPVKMGDRITPERALVRLLDDADTFAQAVKRCAPVPMYQHEFDAYVSLAYNIGPSAFCASTLARKLSTQDYEGACREILRWDKFKGQPVRGLTVRRESEFRQCMGAAS